MGYENCGANPNSKANLLKGSNLPKLMLSDGPSQRLATSILNEEMEWEGKMMTTREVLIRIQVSRAIDEGDLRSCQFLIELAGRSEANADAVKTATANPLEQLQGMMLRSKVDDRRTKTSRKRS